MQQSAVFPTIGKIKRDEFKFQSKEPLYHISMTLWLLHHTSDPMVVLDEDVFERIACFCSPSKEAVVIQH
jgi:hypothetical protein